MLQLSCLSIMCKHVLDYVFLVINLAFNIVFLVLKDYTSL